GVGDHAIDHRLAGTGDAVAGQAHARADLVRGGGADVELAPAGAGDRAAVVGPGAGADDRRVADAAIALVGHAAGRRACGEIPLRIQGNRTDGTEVGARRRGGEQRMRLAVVAQRLLQLLPALLGVEVPGFDQGDALLLREAFRTLAHHHHVARA